DRLRHRPTELSGGQQQRVAVARALVARPQVIFADEPTGNLDTRTGQEILGYLRSAVDDQRQSIVMVTHDPNAAVWADHVVFVVDGRVHDVVDRPSSDAVLDVLKGLGR
ncbi:ABC transporter, partial [cyanobacterium TDX16]